MWIRVSSFRLEEPVTAVLSSDGVWFFMGVDLAPNLDYYSTSYFARRYCPVQLRDIVHRALWTKFPRRDLKIRLVDLETLEGFFPCNQKVQELRRIFYERDEDLLHFSILYDCPSVQRDRSLEVEAAERGDEVFNGDVPMYEFPEQFKLKTMKLYKVLAEGFTTSCETFESEDAPKEVSVCFDDRVTLQYITGIGALLAHIYKMCQNSNIQAFADDIPLVANSLVNPPDCVICTNTRSLTEFLTSISYKSVQSPLPCAMHHEVDDKESEMSIVPTSPKSSNV